MASQRSPGPVAHIDHAADISEVFVPQSARAAVRALRADGTTHVWWWRLDDNVEPEDIDLLDATERARAEHFRTRTDTAAFTLTRAGARRAVAGLLGLDPAEVRIGRRVCPGCGDLEHGPPAVVRPPLPLAVSLSRTAGCGVLALRAWDWLGVDVEARRAMDSPALSELVMTPSERAHLLTLPEGEARTAGFHRAWTRKEAVVKAVGLGLLGMPLHTLDVHPELAGPVEARHAHAGRETRWHVEDLRLPGPWAAALARPLDGTPLGPVLLHSPEGSRPHSPEGSRPHSPEGS